MTTTGIGRDGIELPDHVRDLLAPYGEYAIDVEDEYDVNVGEIITDFREAERADVGLLGIPFDTACVAGPRGSRFGPEGVRERLTHGTCYNPEIDVDISEGLDVVDFGDVRVESSTRTRSRRTTASRPF